MSTDHTSDTDVFRRVLIAAAQTRAGEHPELDAMIAYLKDELEPEQDDAIQEHLAGCRECGRKALDLAELVTPDGSSGVVADLEKESAWRGLRSQLESTSELRTPLTASPHGRRLWMAAAATFLVSTLGLLFSVTQLRESNSGLEQQVARLTRPRVNPPIVYLDEITRSDPSAATAALSTDQPFVLFIAILSAPDAYSSFAAELTNERGEVVWSGSELSLSEEETLRIRLPRELLPEGDYAMRVQGVSDDASETLIRTRLRIQHK